MQQREGEGESRVILFVFLQVSDGKTWDHLKVKRKVSYETERG